MSERKPERKPLTPRKPISNEGKRRPDGRFSAVPERPLLSHEAGVSEEVRDRLLAVDAAEFEPQTADADHESFPIDESGMSAEGGNEDHAREISFDELVVSEEFRVAMAAADADIAARLERAQQDVVKVTEYEKGDAAADFSELDPEGNPFDVAIVERDRAAAKQSRTLLGRFAAFGGRALKMVASAPAKLASLVKRSVDRRAAERLNQKADQAELDAMLREGEEKMQAIADKAIAEIAAVTQRAAKAEMRVLQERIEAAQDSSVDARVVEVAKDRIATQEALQKMNASAERLSAAYNDIKNSPDFSGQVPEKLRSIAERIDFYQSGVRALEQRLGAISSKESQLRKEIAEEMRMYLSFEKQRAANPSAGDHSINRDRIRQLAELATIAGYEGGKTLPSESGPDASAATETAANSDDSVDSSQDDMSRAA